MRKNVEHEFAGADGSIERLVCILMVMSVMLNGIMN